MTSTRRSTPRLRRAPTTGLWRSRVDRQRRRSARGAARPRRHPRRRHRPDRRPRPAQRLPPRGRHARGGGRAAARRPRQARGARAGDDGPPRARDARAARARRGRLRLRQQHPPARRRRWRRRGARRSTSSPRATCGRCSAAGSARSAGSACRARTPIWTLVDELCLELFDDVPRITNWIGLARQHVVRQGLPARIAWLGHGERDQARAGGQRGGRRRAAAGAGRLHPRPHGLRAR